MTKSDVLVLGGGVIGLVTALYLLREGRSVTVVDRGVVGHGASHGNCGTITPSHAMPLAMPGMVAKAFAYMTQPDAPFYLKPRFDPALAAWLFRFTRRCNVQHFRQITRTKAKLLEASRDELERLVRDEPLACEFEALGTLYVYRDLRAFEESRLIPEALKDAGLPIDTLDGAAARAMEPAVNDSIIGGYFNPRDAHLRPDRYASELARRVRELGGVIVEQFEATRIEHGDVVAVHGRDTAPASTMSVPAHAAGFAASNDSTERTLRASTLVFALGAWSPAFARQLGVDLPIQPGKGYSITYDRPGLAPKIPVTLKERQVCVTAWASGFRLGSTMEFSGYDTSLNPVRLGALERGAAEYLREPPAGPRREEWYGWRPMTYDDMPIIGRVPKHSNVVLATGHGMLGITMSAVTGMLVRDIVTGREPALDLAPYAPTRFR